MLISYGTKDPGAPFNDYLHLESIRLEKSNFSYLDYIGWEHNYFGFKDNGEVNYDEYNWDKVGLDWLKWLNEN